MAQKLAVYGVTGYLGNEKQQPTTNTNQDEGILYPPEVETNEKPKEKQPTAHENSNEDILYPPEVEHENE